MNKLTTFMNVAYSAQTHGTGTAHFFNDTEFFREFYALVLGKDQDVIDLGFNIGIQAELLLTLTTGRVFGYEASRRIFEHAVGRFAEEPRVQLFNVAVADRAGTAEFIDTHHWGAGSLQHTAGMDYCGVGDRFQRTSVALARLDDLLPDAKNIGLIKLDIEGAELSAIEGARQLIQRNRPWMVMEYCHNALSFAFRGQPITSRTLFDYAREIDYKVYNIFGICLSHPDVWDASILKDTADVLLVPAEHHARWCEELLPHYQYRIYDKILEKLEWPDSRPAQFYGLTALPSRIYEIVNNSSHSQSLAYLASLRPRLTTLAGGRDELFTTGKLSRRGELLLAMVHDGKIDTAYELATMKTLTAQQLAIFESAATLP